MNFKRYIKEAMLPEKVTRQISLALYDKSGLKKEMDYLIPSGEQHVGGHRRRGGNHSRSHGHHGRGIRHVQMDQEDI